MLHHTQLQAAGSGADPENLHGRWLMGWLPIVNHTGAKGGGWLIIVDISYTILHKRTGEGGWLATLSPPPPPPPPDQPLRMHAHRLASLSSADSMACLSLLTRTHFQ